MTEKKPTRWQRAGKIQTYDVEAVLVYSAYGKPIRVKRLLQIKRFIKGGMR